jgi:hypothetical protein
MSCLHRITSHAVLAALGGILVFSLPNICVGDLPRLAINATNFTAVVTWTNAATVLQRAPTPAGAWSQLPVATSPFVIASTNPAQFYRLFQGCVSPPAGIVSWWTGDGNAMDLVGSNNGSLSGGVTFSNGLVGQAFALDGVSGCVLVPNSAQLNPTGPFSVECWIKASPSQNFPQVLIVDKSHGFVDGTGWLLQTAPGGTVGFGYGDGGDTGSSVNFPVVNATASVLDNQWHHIAGVWTGVELQIYLDGGLQATLGQTRMPVNNTRGVEIGRAWGGGSPTRFFNGLIDEVAYYNTALTSNQVYAIYFAGAAGKCKQ